MGLLPNMTELAGIAAALAPGMIILGVRSRAIVGIAVDYKDRLLAYAFFSAAYYAGMAPFFHVATAHQMQPGLWGFLFYFLMPLVIGILAAFEVQGEWIDRLATKCRLNLTNQTELAWDRAFSKWVAGQYILVTLEDGTGIAGRIDRESFASSSKNQRDLLIGEVWKTNLKGGWTEVLPQRSILILSKDIRSVEFFKGT